uniref:Sulfate_transp domain-containing protein n=1 Tax=Macrostomum lignano TaxID=282301 RepID=A0A1I8GED4_9PLAT
MAELPSSSDRCCSLLTTLLPIAGWLPKYDLQKLRQDAVAGLTVGLMVIPQGLAYAHVAELPVQYGLYSAFMGPFVYCLLGTSKDASLGPTAIMSLLTASYNAAPGVTPKSAVYAVLMCFACGIVQFLLGAMRLGVIVNFISLPVVSGFTTSAAVTIAWSQVKSLLGLRGISNWLPLSVYEICRDIGRTKVWDLTLGLSCMALLLVLMKISQQAKDCRQRSGSDWDFYADVGRETAAPHLNSGRGAGRECKNWSKLDLPLCPPLPRSAALCPCSGTRTELRWPVLSASVMGCHLLPASPNSRDQTTAVFFDKKMTQ